MTDNLPNELWTTAETAQFLRLKLSRLTYLAVRGKIPGSFKAGPGSHADWRFDADKIRAYKLMREERNTRLAGMMNIHEAAKFLRYNEEAVRRLTRQGQISATKDDDGPKAEWRYEKTDLVKFLVSRSNPEQEVTI